MHDATIRFEKRTPLFSCNMQIGSSKTQPRFMPMLSADRSKEARNLSQNQIMMIKR